MLQLVRERYVWVLDITDYIMVSSWVFLDRIAQNPYTKVSMCKVQLAGAFDCPRLYPKHHIQQLIMENFI